MRPPRGTDEVTLGLQIPRALRDQLEQVAAEHSSSLAAATRHLIRRGLIAFESERPERRSSHETPLTGELR